MMRTYWEKWKSRRLYIWYTLKRQFFFIIYKIGCPILACHPGLKDMQRFSPDDRKTFYVTVPVASRSLGPHFRAICPKKESKSFCREFEGLCRRFFV